jgi:hypothetical protein
MRKVGGSIDGSPGGEAVPFVVPSLSAMDEGRRTAYVSCRAFVLGAPMSTAPSNDRCRRLSSYGRSWPQAVEISQCDVSHSEPQ